MKTNFFALVFIILILSVIFVSISVTNASNDINTKQKSIDLIAPVHDTIYLNQIQPIQKNILNQKNDLSSSFEISKFNSNILVLNEKIKDPVFYNSNSNVNINTANANIWNSKKTETIKSGPTKEFSEIEQFRSLGNKASDVEDAIESKTGIKTSLVLTNDIKSKENDVEIIQYSQSYSGILVFNNQSYQRIPVFNSQVTLVKKGVDVVLANYNIYNIEEMSIDLRITEGITEERAIEVVEKDLGLPYEKNSFVGKDGIEQDSEQLTLKIFGGRLSWQIINHGFLYFIDTQTGGILSKQNLIRSATVNINGTVKGKMFSHDPTQAHQLVPFEDNYVFVSNGSYGTTNITNESGYYIISGLAGSNFTVYSYLYGPYADVYNEIIPYAYFYNSSVPNRSTVNWNWTNYDNSSNESESNVFYHLNIIHDYFNNGTSPFDLDEVDYSLRATVEASMSNDCGGGSSNCNACYVPGAFGGQLFFGNGSGEPSGCQDTALGSDIIYHEYTHWVTDSVYNNSPVLEYALQPGAMSEGFSDYFATTINNDSEQGDNIVPPSWVRDLNNNYVYPADFVYEVHADSPMFSGALWDLRELIGNDTAEILYLYALEIKPVTFPDFLFYILIWDELLNGGNLNLWDGTPHSDEICTAFYANHGIFSDFCLYYNNISSSFYDNYTEIEIPDYNGDELQWVNSIITIPNNENVTINDLQVYVDVSEVYTYDALIKLIAPNGTSLILYDGSGIQGAGGCWNPWAYLWDGRNFWSYHYSAGQISWWFDKELPPDGEDCDGVTNMSVFDGMESNGTWTLSVADTWSGGSGTINEFSLQIYSDEYVIEDSPEVEIQSPTNTTYYSTSIDLDFIATDGDSTPVDQCWYSLNEGVNNISLINCTNVTLTLAEASYHLIVWANDTADYEGYDNVNFTVDEPDCGCEGVSWTYICGDYVSESCTMTCNLTSTGTCFTVIHDDIIIDGNGSYSLTGNNTYYYYDGINIIGYDNVTVKNFVNITNFSSGIYAYEVTGLTLQNDTIQENTNYDVEFIPISVSACDAVFTEVHGSGGNDIVFHGTADPFLDAGAAFSEVILCNADASVATDSQIFGSNTLNNNGLFAYFTDFSVFDNVNSSNNYYGMYFSESHVNNFYNNTANFNEMRGLYLNDSAWNDIEDNILQENGQYDFFLSVTDPQEYCSQAFFINNTGSNDLPILYYDSAETIEDEVVSEIELCDADGSVINNVIISASQNLDNNGIVLFYTDDSNITNTASNENYVGLYAYDSDENLVSNFSASNNYAGIYFPYGDNNTVEDSNASSNLLIGVLFYGTLEVGGSIIYGNSVDNVTANSNGYMGIGAIYDVGFNLTNSIANSNDEGILLTVADASITNNIANSNWIGMETYWSYGSVIEENVVQNSEWYAFYSSVDDGSNIITDLDIGPVISFVPVAVAINNSESPDDDPTDYENIDEFINVTSTFGFGGSSISLNVSYDEDDLGENDESTLTMFRYDEDDNEWYTTRGAGVNEDEDYVYSGTVTDFSIFAPMIEGGGTGGCFLAGTKILMQDGTEKSIEKIKTGEKVLSYNEATDLIKTSSVEKTFKHFVSSYLVINNEIKVTNIHPIYVDGNWVEAGELKIGDEMKTKTGIEKVYSIKKINKPVYVYNLEVNSEHNYFASGILVHNKGGGGGGGTPVNQTTENESIGELGSYGSSGFTKNFELNQSIYFVLNGAIHSLTVTEILESSVIVKIQSTPIIAALAIGKPKNIDLNGDGVNDISINLNSITGNKASITITSIEKPIVTGEEQNQTGNTGEQGQTQKKSFSSNTMIYIIVAIVIIVAIIVFVFVPHKSYSKYSKK